MFENTHPKYRWEHLIPVWDWRVQFGWQEQEGENCRAAVGHLPRSCVEKWKCYCCSQRSSDIWMPIAYGNGFWREPTALLAVKYLKSQTTVLCSHSGGKVHRAAWVKGVKALLRNLLSWCFGWELEYLKPRGLKLLPDSWMFPLVPGCDFLQRGCHGLKEVFSGRPGCSREPGTRVMAGFLQGTIQTRHSEWEISHVPSFSSLLMSEGPWHILCCILEPTESFGLKLLPSYPLSHNQNLNWQHMQWRGGVSAPLFG